MSHRPLEDSDFFDFTCGQCPLGDDSVPDPRVTPSSLAPSFRFWAYSPFINWPFSTFQAFLALIPSGKGAAPGRAASCDAGPHAFAGLPNAAFQLLLRCLGNMLSHVGNLAISYNGILFGQIVNDS
jgi:hypothetical protein